MQRVNVNALVSTTIGITVTSQELYSGTPNSPAEALAPVKLFVVTAIAGGEVTDGIVVGDVEGAEDGVMVEFTARGNI